MREIWSLGNRHRRTKTKVERSFTRKDLHSTMYAESSNEYWRQRRKSNPYRLKVLLSAGTMFFLLVLGISDRLVSNSQKRKKDEEIRILKEQTLIRPTATDRHFSVCNDNMRDSALRECSSVCANEYMTLPKPLMYQACIHGCTTSFVSAALIGCQNFGSEEDAVRKNSVDTYKACSRYQHSDPRPHVLSVCRKYHREGTKFGRNKAVTFLNSLLDAELLSQQNEFQAKHSEV